MDPTWPRTLPNDWILGDIRGLFVDESDHLWVVPMPSSLTRQEIGAAQDPPIADCCFPAPPVPERIPRATSCKPGAGWAALRAAASRVFPLGANRVTSLGRSARTHEGLRPPVFKFAAIYCVPLRLVAIAFGTALIRIGLPTDLVSTLSWATV